MRNHYDNSSLNAVSVQASTLDPRNGSSHTRTDVVRSCDWQVSFDYNRTPVMPNAVLAGYLVLADSMRALSKHLILPNDELKAETIPFTKVVTGKTYIVTDYLGNVYLGRITKAGKTITIHYENTLYLDTVIERKNIVELAVVYRVERWLYTPEQLKEREYLFN